MLQGVGVAVEPPSARRCTLVRDGIQQVDLSLEAGSCIGSRPTASTYLGEYEKGSQGISRTAVVRETTGHVGSEKRHKSGNEARD